MNGFRVFSGTSNPGLARAVAAFLGKPLGRLSISRFSDGEVRLGGMESVRGKDVFFIQSTCPPVNENLMELAIAMDAFRRASAESITAVIPYFGYARQDRITEPRAPIAAKLVANLTAKSGADRVVTLELHAPQIEGFFEVPVDNVRTDRLFAEHWKREGTEDLVVVSPDVGGVKRARAFATLVGAPIAVIDKHRPAPNESDVMNLIGDVRGKRALVYDDMIDTGGTLVKAAEALVKAGATEVRACAAHGVFSGTAYEKLGKSSLKEVVVTDSIPLRPGAPANVKTVPSARLLGTVLKAIAERESTESALDAAQKSLLE